MKKLCLIVIDGWGLQPPSKGNAIAIAKTPFMDKLGANSTQAISLEAHGLSVGLPRGLMGNSEVGHLNIGAGRPVYQDIVKVNLSIENNQLCGNQSLVDAFNRAKSGTQRVHFIGLVSDGGVHSHQDHLYALLKAAKDAGVPQSFVHFIADGRDTLPTTAAKYMQALLDYMKTISYGCIASVIGRYYAMDRDKRKERVQTAYDAYVKGSGFHCSQDDVVKVIQDRYSGAFGEAETDEFLKPIIIDKCGGCDCDANIKNDDVLVFFNYRSDRMRQIVEAFFVSPPMETDVIPKVHIYSMTKYKEGFTFPNLFPPTVNDNVLAEWISKKNLKQYHVAETEKYAHITFFFNGGQERQFTGEEREMISSPKVATYDLKPEMSCQEVANAMSKALKQQTFSFCMLNFAPPDMVGHTGKLDPCIKACEATDKAIETVFNACKETGYTFLLTADHGNAEIMICPETSGPFTQHTCSKVPFYLGNSDAVFKVPSGHTPALSDVAPTVLALMGLDVPKEMSGKSLI